MLMLKTVLDVLQTAKLITKQEIALQNAIASNFKIADDFDNLPLLFYPKYENIFEL